jgi:hypothetical protein
MPRAEGDRVAAGSYAPLLADVSVQAQLDKFLTTTLRAVDLHAPGSQLTHTWNKAQTGDNLGTSVDVYSPLYVDLDGLRVRTIGPQ